MGVALSMGMGVGLSFLLLAVSTVLAVLRGGRRRRHRRDDRHRAVPRNHGRATLLLRAAVLLRATLSPPASRCWHCGRRGACAGFRLPAALVLRQTRRRAEWERVIALYRWRLD